MPTDTTDNVVDSLTLRFDGETEDGSPLHELRAAHVAEVLQGLVGLTDDFDKAGAFHADGPAGSEVLVRPAEQGSFLIEVVRVANEFIAANGPLIGGVGAVTGVPTIGQLIKWSTRSARAEVKDFVRDKENDTVKVIWQDDTAEEVPTAVWVELNKRKRRRKKHLRQLMAPLSDPRVQTLDVAINGPSSGDDEAEVMTLRRSDYDAVKPEDDVSESDETFEVEAQMSAIDFEDSKKWKVKTATENRGAVMDDATFLREVADGLAIRKDDIFRLSVRADKTVTNGSTRTTWTVLEVLSHRRAAGDNDS